MCKSFIYQVILSGIEERGRAEGAPIVTFPEREISVEGEDIYVGRKWLEWFFFVNAFYLALPPHTYGVVVYPDGKAENKPGGMYKNIASGLYTIHYVDKHERIIASEPISEITTDGEKLTLQIILRYCVADPVLVLSITNPVEALMELVEADVAQYIRTHDHSEIANSADNSNSRLFSFFSERHNKRKPLSDAISITGIELKEFIDERKAVEMRRKNKIQLEQKTLSPALQKIQQEQEKQLLQKASLPKNVSEIIFISYRRTDSADIAGRIYDRLVGRFGKAAIFKDVDSIPLGFDFKEYLEKKVSECSILLAIIGDRWLEANDPTGKNRLNDPNDFVRIEIETALARNILVIPLLVRGAVMPAGEKLPISLRKLVYRNYIPIRADPDFHRDIDRLISSLERHLHQRS